MVLRAHVHPQDSTAPAPAVTPDHVDLAAASPVRPRTLRGAWERLVSRRLPHDLRALGTLVWRILHAALCKRDTYELGYELGCTWHCTPAYSSLISACGVRRTMCDTRPLHALLPERTKRCNTSSFSAPTSRRDRLACAAMGSNLADWVCCPAALCDNAAGG